MPNFTEYTSYNTYEKEPYTDENGREVEPRIYKESWRRNDDPGKGLECRFRREDEQDFLNWHSKDGPRDGSSTKFIKTLPRLIEYLEETILWLRKY